MQGAQGSGGAQGAAGTQGGAGTQGAQGAQGGGATLFATYAFGVSDEPPNGQPNDNLFGMPAGNLRYPGYTDYGAARGAAEIMWFQQKAPIALSSPPSYELISQAWQNSGIGGFGCATFRINELNDPNWNLLFGSISGGTAWITETIAASNDPTEDSTHATIFYGRRSFDANAQSNFVPGGGGAGGFALETRQTLYNDQTGALEIVQNVTGYGMRELLCLTIQNGANAQWVTHWNNNAPVPAAGDGPAWWVDGNGLFGHFVPVAGVNPYQKTNDYTLGWGVKLWGRTAAGALTLILDADTDRTSVFALEVPYADSTVVPKSAANTARLIYDPNIGKYMASVNGAAYVNLSTVS